MYFSYLDEWERQFPQFQADTESARSRFKTFVSMTREDSEAEVAGDVLFEPVKPAYMAGTSFVRLHYRRIAVAAAVLMIGIWLSRDVWYYRTYTSRNHEVLAITLEDGSEIALEANSSLKYPRFGFGWKTRNVWLDGDAVFKVAHLDETRRFKVHTADQTVIEVLGTEFVVNSRRKATKVMLKSGSIRLTNPITEKPLLMEPGDFVTISVEKKIQKEQLGALPDEFNWKVRDFEFKNTPLTEVAKQLYEAYGVNVRITQKAIVDRTVSGTFQAETAEDLLEAISEMMHLEAETAPDGYLLRERKD